MTVRHFLCLLLLAAGASADPLRGDINDDGLLNVADRVLLGAMLGGGEPATDRADLDGDGVLTAADAEILADLLLGRPAYEPLGTAALPPDGTPVVVGDLQLGSQAGTFVAPAMVRVASAWRSLGHDDPEQSAVFRLDGVPYHGTGGLVLSLPAPARRREGGTTMILFGEEVAAPSNGLGLHIASRAIPATLAGGRYEVQLPPLPPPPADREGELPETARIYVQRVDSLLLDSYEITADRAGLALDLVSPDTTLPEEKQRVVDALALAARTISGLGFDLAKRTSPVKIEVKKLDQGTCGFYQPSMVSLNWTSIDINQSLVTDPAQVTTLRRTLIHEYFHMVQATYDPRSAFVQSKYNAPQLWIDEAASVWIEKFASGGATSDYMEDNAGEMMKGIHAECSGIAFRNAASRTRAQDHGYGMSMMFEYMFGKSKYDENPTLVNIYRKLADGMAPEAAFLSACATPDPTTWWDGFLVAYGQSQVGQPPIPFADTFANVTQRHIFPAKSTESQPVTRTLMRHDKFQSSAMVVNWVNVPHPARGGRRLVAELRASDDQFGLMAFQQRAGSKSPCLLRATSTSPMGKFGNDYYTLLTDLMENHAPGAGPLKSAHYLLARRLLDSAPGAALPVLDVWYVNTSQPIAFARGSKARRLYKVDGHAECGRILRTEEGIMVSGEPLLIVEAGGVVEIPIHLAVVGTADSNSYYTTTGYTIQVHHARSQTETVTETIGTYPGTDLTVDFVARLAEGDVGATVVVLASEDVVSGAPPGVYFLNTNMFPLVATRYDYMLQSMNAPPAGR